MISKAKTNDKQKLSRVEKAEEVRDALRDNGLSMSDREIAKQCGTSNVTVSKYRKQLEQAGEILLRIKSLHSMQPRFQEVLTFAITPAPENDKLYDPVRQDDPSFLGLVKDMKRNGLINAVGVSTDGYIFDGHRRYAAAKRLRWDKIQVRIDPEISRTDDPDGFLRRLRSCNEQRVKNTSEAIRETLVDAKPNTWHRLCNYRETVSEIDGAEVFHLHGQKKRCAIVQKRSLAAAIVRVVRKYFKAHGATSDRKIFYLLLNETGLLRNDSTESPFENSDDCYQDVTDMLVRLRLDGSIPFDAISDETRPVLMWNTHRHVGTFVAQQTRNFLCNYWRDLLQSQPNHVEMLAEKNTIATVLHDLAAKYTLPMTSGRGYSSLPPRKAMVDRFKESGKEKLILVAVTDMDPEGMDIPHAFGLSLRDDFDIDPDRLVIIKAALTHQQTQELDIHEGREANSESARYDAYVDAYGERVWELEAVDNDVLVEIVEGTIRNTIDLDAFNDERDREYNEKGELSDHRQRALDALGDVEWEGGDDD